MSRIRIPLLLLLLVTPIVYANVGRDYGESVRALSRQDWDRAEQKIRDALEAEDQPKSSIEISGGIRFPYMPWYVLGAALKGQGDCDGAVNAWNRSLDAGVVRNSSRELEKLQAGMQECQILMAEAAADPPVPDEAEPETVAQTSEATDVTSDEPSIPEENGRDKETSQPAESGSEVAQRRQVLLAQQAEADRRRHELEQRNRLNDAQRALRSELDRIAPAINDSFGDGAVTDARVRLVELSHASTDLLASESISELNRQSERLRQAGREYDQLTQEWRARQQAIAYRTPPPRLLQIADLYFSGDYQAVFETADPSEFEENRQKVQTLLFRSAARFNRYWLQGAIDATLLEHAQEDIRAIKRLNPSFRPYVAAFSPRFLSFFNEIGQ